MDKKIIGVSETITVKGMKVLARIDTGATKSSIDKKLAAELKLGPVMEKKLIKSAHGTMLRPIINVQFTLAGKKMTEKFTIADRTHLRYKVLIGRNALIKGFLVDPSKE